MSYITENRIRHIRKVIDTYDHGIPFHHFLREHFRHNRQYGSSDRRLLRQYCYAYLRTGNLFAGSFEKKLAAAVFLTTEMPDPVFEVLNRDVKFPVSESDWVLPAAGKLKLLDVCVGDIFPFTSELSALCQAEAFVQALLMQPLLWVRVRRGQENVFVSILRDAKVPFQKHAELPAAFGLPNGFDLDELLRKKNKENLAEVQDLSSQQACHTFKLGEGMRLWDCCAASGGKSLLLMDTYSKTQLYASDIRETVLHNLKDRFRRNGISQYHIAHADLFNAPQSIHFDGKGCDAVTIAHDFFDVLLVDAPCSGSGTWGRTPEQITTCTSDLIDDYAERQKLIVQNALPFLRKGGLLVYMTCSVFAAENEKQTAHFIEQHGLHLQQEQLIQGHAHRADTLFVAVMQK